MPKAQSEGAPQRLAPMQFETTSRNLLQSFSLKYIGLLLMNDCITSSIDHVENSSSLSNIGLSLLNVNINLKIKKKNGNHRPDCCSPYHTGPLLQVALQQGWAGRGCWWGVINYKRQRRPKHRRDSHCQQVHRQNLGSHQVFCLWKAHHSLCLVTSWEPPWAPLASALLPLGARVLVLGEGKAHTQREQTHPGLKHQDFCSINLGSNSVPNRVVVATEQRGKSSLTPVSGLSPSITSPISYQDDSCQHILREDETSVQLKSSSLTKSNDHTQTVQGPSHTRAPLQDCNR